MLAQWTFSCFHASFHFLERVQTFYRFHFLAPFPPCCQFVTKSIFLCPTKCFFMWLFLYHTINGNRKKEIFSNFTWLFHMACFVLTINEKWKQEHNMSLLKTMPLVYDRWLCGNHPAFYSRNWNNLWRLKSCQYWEFILASFVTNNVLHSVIFEPCRWTCKVVLVFAFMFLDYAIVFEWYCLLPFPVT